MLLKINESKYLNTDYFVSVGVSKMKEASHEKSYIIAATLINGQIEGLFDYKTRTEAEEHLKQIVEKSNIHKTEVENVLSVKEHHCFDEVPTKP